MAIGTTALAAASLVGATINMVAGDDTQLAQLQLMQSRVAAMSASVKNLQGNVVQTAQRLEQRQQFLATLLSGKGNVDQLVAMLPRTQVATAQPIQQPSILAPFAQLEQEQLAFVGKATIAAEARTKAAVAQLRRLGLSPQRFIGQSNFAMGGPFEPAATDADPKFAALFVSWKKLDQLEDALAAVPSVKPVKGYSYTSGFGVRYDPFSGRTAMHAGVDMAGPTGEAIYAAADGVVGKAGWGGAYGNMIDLDHGKGMATRYGHMSRLLVSAGDRVKAGDVIGRMGSTGRSTGSHLHYEVRVDGRAVNPRPFLEAGPALLAMQDRGLAQGGPELAAK